jgi:hypothetical protein
MVFKKGDPPGPGRPEGSKSKNCMNPVFWFNMLDDCLHEIKGEARMPHVFRALELLMPKIANLPGTPADSLSNAAMAEALEAKRRSLGTLEAPPNAPGLDSTGVSNGNGDIHP